MKGKIKTKDREIVWSITRYGFVYLFKRAINHTVYQRKRNNCETHPLICPVPVPKCRGKCARRIHTATCIRALEKYIHVYTCGKISISVDCQVKLCTAAREIPTTEKPNLIAVESVVCAHLGSQVAQAAQSINDVQRISIRMACVVLIPGCTTVTQWPTDELEYPSLNNSGGVIIYRGINSTIYTGINLCNWTNYRFVPLTFRSQWLRQWIELLHKRYQSESF